MCIPHNNLESIGPDCAPRASRPIVDMANRDNQSFANLAQQAAEPISSAKGFLRFGDAFNHLGAQGRESTNELSDMRPGAKETPQQATALDQETRLKRELEIEQQILQIEQELLLLLSRFVPTPSDSATSPTNSANPVNPGENNSPPPVAEGSPGTSPPDLAGSDSVPGTSTGTDTGESPAKAGANFSVHNGKIIDPDGKTFIAKGLDVDGTVSNADVDAILKNFPNLNFIRLATGPSGAPLSTDKNTIKGPDSVDKIQQFINKMTAHGIVVEVENHGAGFIPTGAAMTEEDAWFSQLASQNKNNPYVWFGSANEPWEHNLQDATNAVIDQQQLYKTIRSTGNNNMIMLETSYDKFSNTDIYTRNQDLASYHNVAIDSHYYDTNGSALKISLNQFQSISSADGKMPVIIGEYGPSTGPGAGTTKAQGVTNIEAVQNAVNAGQAAGAVAWCLGTLKGTSAKSWTDTDAILIPTNKFDPSQGLTLTGWGEEVSSWIATGKVGTGV